MVLTQRWGVLIAISAVMASGTASVKAQSTGNVDCKHGEWSIWEDCNSVNVQTRRRTIDVPASGRGTPCGPTIETLACQAVDCELRGWSKWAKCNSLGKAQRQSSVKQPDVRGGKKCPPVTQEQDCTAECDLNECAEWGPCDAATGKQVCVQSLALPTKLDKKLCRPDATLTRSCVMATPVPTTDIPVTGNPPTVIPPTEVPTTEGPTTVAPTEGPTTEGPTTEGPCSRFNS